MFVLKANYSTLNNQSEAWKKLMYYNELIENE